ncbi:MAG: sugar nucleotide-binding protein [Planctomycetota bacterium]|nr:sugar nucleotide-binding protein [Planctomycetota bacterium]
MLSKKIFLIGNGHLGGFLADLWKILPELHWQREMMELDVATLKRVRPEAVVNTAGKTDLRWCEDHAYECFRCNVIGPVHVYRALKQALDNKVPYIHLSSGCVWDGPFRPDGKPFTPCDPPTPACFYSWTKASCDALLMAEAAAPLLILRPRQVYSPLASPRNTLAKLNGYPRLLDTPNSMTSADTIARTIEIALGSSDPRVWNRIMNVYERGSTSPFEVGTFLAQAGCRQPPEKLSKSDLDAWHKPKRVDAVLEDKFFEDLVKPPTVQEELKRNIALYAKAIGK